MGVDRDEVVYFLFQQRDIQPQLLTPMVQAIPLHGALGILETPKQLRFGRRDTDSMTLGIAQGHVLAPEVVVEMQVQQGAVHIEKYRADLGPVDHGVN